MNNYKRDINLKTVENMCDFAINNGIDFDMYEGCLQDNYIFYDTLSMKMGRAKPRKFIIVREKYINHWSSGLEMILTDDEKLMDSYLETFDKKEL